MTLAMCCGMTAAFAQQYQVPVSELHEKMQTGKYQPTWESLETHQTPEWFCEVRHLGALGTSVRRGFRRLDGPQHVYGGQP